MVSYAPLWKTMERKHITQYRLIHYYHFSAGQLGRMKKNMYVSTHTIETLCCILDCSADDIMEIIPDPAKMEWIKRAEQEWMEKVQKGENEEGKE